MTKDEAPVTRVGNWMQVTGGKAFWPLDPRIEEIDFDTIAAALSKICRFGGHTTEFYSVAEHCVRISEWLEAEYGDRDLALRGLLHDGAEAYVGDMVRPLKYAIPHYREIENRILNMIHVKAGLTFGGSLHLLVADADNRILLDERDQFLEDSPYLWFQDLQELKPLGIEWSGSAWNPDSAKGAWMDRLEELTR